MRHWFIRIVFLISGFLLFSQHPEYYKFTEKDGLPDYEFYDMLIDNKGFVWFAANNGLYRYDGQEFKNYSNPEKRGLSVFGLLEDDEGGIWCNNMAGQIFKVVNDSLHIFTDIKEFSDGSRVEQFTILNNNLYCTSDQGLLKINRTDTTLSFLKSNKDSLKTITYFPRILDNKLLYGENSPSIGKKAFIYNDRTNTIEYLTLNQPYIHNLFTTKNITLINHSRSWEKTDLYLLKSTSSKPIKILDVPEKLKESRSVHLFEDTEGFLWLSTGAGVFRFRIVNQTMTDIRRFFPDHFVSRVQQDRKGNFWVSTVDDGVYIIPNLHIVKFTTQHSNPKEYSISNLAKDTANQLFFGLRNDLLGTYDVPNNIFSYVKNPSYNSFVKKLRYEKQYDMVVSLGPKMRIYKDRSVFNLHFDNWTDYSILPNDKILYSTIKTSGIIDNFFEDFSKEPKNIALTDTTGVTHKTLRKKRSYKNHYSKNFKRSYVSSLDGLYMYDKDFRETEITYDGNPIYATGIAETSDGIVWVSTFSYGLLGIVHNEVVARYGADTILATNTIKTIETEGLHLWVATDQGLQYIQRSDTFGIPDHVITIDENDGLSTKEINDIEIIGNDVFLATQKGLLKLDKTKSYTNTKEPDIYIKNITINGKDTLVSRQYQLSYKNNVTIAFNSNSFNNPNGKHLYLYRLKGVDEDWNQKTSALARYSLIPAGTYTFEVKAVNEDGMESSTPATITFVVSPPYWQSWWFYVLIGMGAFAVTALLFNLRIRQVRQQNYFIKQKREIELELINSKLTALRSQMNPHFLFNALNSIQEYILTNQKDLASDYLGKFADLMRIYLDHSKKNYITVQEEIDAMRLYLDLEKIRFEDTLEFTIEVDTSDSSISSYKIPSLLIQPYVENALKHGLLHKKTDRQLSISFSRSTEEKELLICQIEDNGIGRERSFEINSKRYRKHTSFASDAGKTRLELLNHDKKHQIGLEIIDLKKENTPQGTKVILRIPFIKN